MKYNRPLLLPLNNEIATNSCRGGSGAVGTNPPPNKCYNGSDGPFDPQGGCSPNGAGDSSFYCECEFGADFYNGICEIGGFASSNCVSGTGVF